MLLMLAEFRMSRRNERNLLRLGAFEPPDDVYSTMRWAYPGVFIAMALEGALTGRRPGIITLAGLIVFCLAKAMKLWAVRSLGSRWTFRVLVPPDVPLVVRGPYAFLRHPNYVAVVGEMVGMALLVGAPISGPIGTLLFSALLRRRIQVENLALRTSVAAASSRAQSSR